MSTALQRPHARTVWEEGSRPGHEVTALAVAVLLTVVVLDLLVGARLGLLFDLGLVVTCGAAALAVRPPDFFAVGVLPPLAMLGVAILLGVAEPAAVAKPDDGVAQATISGLSGHAIALVIAYAACLGILAERRHWLARAAARSV